MQLPVEIESAFETGATVLTANLRAARWLRHEYALRQRDAGRRVWATPPIEDWESWVLRLWQTHSMGESDTPLLLISLQERSVWTRMQREDAKLLVSPEGMAALAEEAYALLCDYEAHAERNRAWGQTDAERFRTWAAAFDRECAKRGWVSRARLESLVAEVASALSLPAKVVMLGFDRITPARKRLIASLEAQGVEVVTSAGASVASAPRLVRATDLRDEITTCAHWIRGLLDENPLFESKPPARIGVIVPDAQAVRSDIERIFRRVLMPETDDILAPAARMPFEFSLGQPLGSAPVIRAALLLLRWARNPLSEEEVSWLLLSGYLSQSTELRAQGTEEYLALASFDAALRNSGSLSLEISLRNTLRKMRDGRFPALANLHAHLENMQKMAAVNHISEEERAPGRWVDLAQFLLEQAGWRGATRRDEIDFQARARWERLLDDVALLDFDGRRMRYREFIDTLETQANETIFAPESHGAPVQVMGALEASGQQFDAVWFLGADDQAWPGRGRLHPLLPNDLQRRAGMPHATAEDDWELASVVTKRIAAQQGSGNRDQGTEPRAHSKPTPGFEWGTWQQGSGYKDQGSEPRAHSKPKPGFEWGTQHQGSGNRDQGSEPRAHSRPTPGFEWGTRQQESGNRDQGTEPRADSQPTPGFEWGTRQQGSGNRDQGTEPRADSQPTPGFEWGTRNSVIFSYAERDKDGELRPSPLIAQVAEYAHSKPTPGFEWGTQATWQRSRELLHELGIETGVHAADK